MVKGICDIMGRSNCAGALQYVPELTWILFLRNHSWTVERNEIEARGYDLKAVNPHAKRDEDTRTPEELLDIIEAKGREVSEALAALRALTGKKM